GAEAEPAAHLHECVGLLGGAAVVSDGQAFDGKAAGELGAADEDLPDVRRPVEVELELGEVAVGVPVYDGDGLASASDALTSGIDVRPQLVVGGRRGQITGLSGADRREVSLPQRRETLVPGSGGVPSLVPHGVDAQRQVGVVVLTYRLVDQHRVMTEVRVGYTVL